MRVYEAVRGTKQTTLEKTLMVSMPSQPGSMTDNPLQKKTSHLPNESDDTCGKKELSGAYSPFFSSSSLYGLEMVLISEPVFHLPPILSTEPCMELIEPSDVVTHRDEQFYSTWVR